jgi:NADPH2:quinone reductase
MRAAYLSETGPPENIQVGPLPDPVPREREVLVRVTAAAVNPIDTYVRSGLVAMELPLPFVVGCDLAGVVDEVGSEVSRFQVGDRVWGSNQGLLGRQGTFAELAAVDQQWLYPTPKGVDDETVVAVALVGITAHLGLVREAKLQAGETVVVSGGSGAVGSTVIQMARALGAQVLATTGSAEGITYCQALGADRVINYQTEDVSQRITEVAPKGVDLWWETSRDVDFDLAIGALGQGGRLILMAGRDARPQFPVGPFYVKCCRLLGFAMFQAPAEAQRRAAEAINQWLIEGKLKPTVDRVVPLEETPTMHRLQEENTLARARTLHGKIVVRM